MDGEDLNVSFNGFQRQDFTKADEGGLTCDIGGERRYALNENSKERAALGEQIRTVRFDRNLEGADPWAP